MVDGLKNICFAAFLSRFKGATINLYIGIFTY